MTTLVTGGDGFVGQHLIARLLDEGADVLATHLGETPAPGTLSPTAREGIAWRRVELPDAAGLAAIFEEGTPRRVFHLAGLSSSAEAREWPERALRVNGEGTLALMRAARDAGLDGPLVVAGSGEAYGRSLRTTEGPVTEAEPLEPETPYGVSKAAQELVALGAARAWGLDVRVARFFPLVGPGQRGPFVLPSFCRRAARIARGTAEPRLRVGNLDIERDFTDVRDGSEALVRLAGLERPGAPCFNVSSGRGTPVGRLLAWVLEAAGIDPEVVRDPELVREGEARRVVGDPGRLARGTGWRVERDVRTAVRETYQWIREDEERSGPWT